MNEVLKAISERYSCRDFADTPLTREQVEAIAKAAAAAPSAMDRQPWRVIMVNDKAIVDRLDEEGMKALAAAEDRSSYIRIQSRGGKLFYNAPCMAMIASDGSSYAAMDCGILSQNVALAAHSLGLGSVICGMANIPLSGPKGAELKKLIKFPEGWVFGMAVLLGTPKSGKKPHEPDMGKVTYI